MVSVLGTAAQHGAPPRSKTHLFIKRGAMNSETVSTENRFKTIIKYNVITIVLNLFLSIGKLVIGTLTNAHAVILDGIEGFSDLISSVFTIFSSKIGEKKADKMHPFGYGRIEYLVSLLVTIIIMLVGVRSIVESVKEILEPQDPPAYNVTVVIIMVISLVVKLSLGIILRKKGKEVNSEAMIMSGVDSMSDSLTSVAILAAILVKKLFDIDIEHYLCIGISLLIIWTGVQMLRECATKLIGTPVDPEFRKKIKSMIIMENGVYNVGSLVIHNYGEGVYVGSADIEVDEDMRASEITSLTREITKKAEDLGLTLTAVGISGTNTSSPQADSIKDTILDIVRQHKSILKAHSFNVDFRENRISFSIVLNYDDTDKESLIEELKNELQSAFPDKEINIQTSMDI